MSEPIRCGNCDSPDLAPYKFGDDLAGVIYSKWYRNARKCMDCGTTYYDVEIQLRAPLNFAKLGKTP